MEVLKDEKQTLCRENIAAAVHNFILLWHIVWSFFWNKRISDVSGSHGREAD